VPLARLVRLGGVDEIRPEHVTQDLRQQISIHALVSRLEALERIHAATLDPAPSEFSPKTMSAAAGGTLTVFGRNYDLGASFRVTLLNELTFLRLDPTVGQRAPTQAVVAVPAGAVPPGPYLVLVSNDFGTAPSRDRLIVTA
jgi:hypothetical protein